MNAKYLVQRYPHSLIGRTVLTERIGEWPGGPAEVIQLNPDPAAPEIVMTVRHKTATDPATRGRYWEMGIFRAREPRVVRNTNNDRPVMKAETNEALQEFADAVASLAHAVSSVAGIDAVAMVYKADKRLRDALQNEDLPPKEL